MMYAREKARSEYYRLLRKLIETGEVSFVIPRQKKMQYKNHISRINRLFIFLRKSKKNKTLLFITYLYGLYVTLEKIYICRDSEEMNLAIIFYTAAIDKIKFVKGADYLESSILVTYIAKQDPL